MSTVAEEIPVIDEDVAAPASARITTTLYDLMAAIQTVVEPEDDACIVATITHWLHTGRLTFLGDLTAASDDRMTFHPLTPHHLS